MLSPGSWADIILMRLARQPLVGLSNEEQRMWLEDLIMEIQADVMPVKGNA